MSKIILTKPCKVWTRSTSRAGYGRAWRGGKVVDIHRWTYEQAKGPLPAGMCVLHHCDNPPCYELEHLFAGTKGNNSRDMAEKNRVRFGTAHHNAKLDDARIRAICADNRTCRAIAADYSIAYQTVSKIRRKERWVRVV